MGKRTVVLELSCLQQSASPSPLDKLACESNEILMHCHGTCRRFLLVNMKPTASPHFRQNMSHVWDGKANIWQYNHESLQSPEFDVTSVYHCPGCDLQKATPPPCTTCPTKWLLDQSLVNFNSPAWESVPDSDSNTPRVNFKKKLWDVSSCWKKKHKDDSISIRVDVFWRKSSIFFVCSTQTAPFHRWKSPKSSRTFEAPNKLRFGRRALVMSLLKEFISHTQTVRSCWEDLTNSFLEWCYLRSPWKIFFQAVLRLLSCGRDYPKQTLTSLLTCTPRK